MEPLVPSFASHWWDETVNRALEELAASFLEQERLANAARTAAASDFNY
jgi:hypothetical protein